MKAIGIEIENCKAIMSIVEKKESNYEVLNLDFNSLEIVNHKNCEEVKSFLTTLHSFFKTTKPNYIGIISRNHKGGKQFKVSPLSFKIEGLIQLYGEISVDLIAPQTLSAYYKKNVNTLIPKYKYQKKAMDLAYYLIKKNE